MYLDDRFGHPNLFKPFVNVKDEKKLFITGYSNLYKTNCREADLAHIQVSFFNKMTYFSNALNTKSL